jgi:hypothetical protein
MTAWSVHRSSALLDTSIVRIILDPVIHRSASFIPALRLAARIASKSLPSAENEETSERLLQFW